MRWRASLRMTFVEHAPTHDSGASHHAAAPDRPMTDAPLTARRDQIVAQLGAAWAAEAIGEQEMERRMSAAFAARESADLERLVADLPMPHALAPLTDSAHAVAPRGPQLAPLRRVVFSSVDERVRSVVPARLELGSRFGSIAMNFTEAVFANVVTEIVVDVVFGNVELTFPPGIAIECDVHGIFANVETKAPAVTATQAGHVVRISGRALFGNVEIDVTGATREE